MSIATAFAVPETREGMPTNKFMLEAGPLANILVVDDENGPRQALRILLKERYDVALATNVPEALKLLEQQAVDVIVTDIRMPQQTGIDLLRHVKTTYPDVPVIMLTGYGQLDTAMEAMDHGAFAYLEKPFDHEAMMEKVADCVSLKRRESERRALEQLSLEANRFETLGRLIAGTLHDLGTPLSVIGSHLELLLANPKKPDAETRLQTMLEQLHHCNEMVRSTMNFLRQAPTVQGRFDLNNVVERCLDVAKPLLAKQQVAVHVNLSADIDYAPGDLVLVRQAVLNLVYNAVQAMDQQDLPRRIWIDTWAEDENVCLSIEDSGPGIEREKQLHIFDPLFSTKGNSGTGLGLAVVHNVVQRHGGKVGLEPRQQGARFVLRFPAA